MIIAYTENEFNNAKSDDLLKLKCEQCGKFFYKPKKEIKHSLEHPERNRCRFCSQECVTNNIRKECHVVTCVNCGKEIEISNSEYKRSKTKNFFCSHTCAAIYNNKKRIITEEQKRKTSESLKRDCVEQENIDVKKITKKIVFSDLSDEEFKQIIESCKTWYDVKEKFGYKNVVPTKSRKSIIKRCEKLEIKYLFGRKDTSKKTKKEMFDTRKNWQSARSGIRKIAYQRFFNENKDCKCIVCGYSKHVEVAHIKAVSEFDDNATVDEINNINNLIGLCPNHHWEFDNGLLNINDYI